ncbi:HAMP domain-containing protein [Actinomadura logoneensis]|uniref:histidine kinase n=1 Tax=Actinomadura logoneensis TaxID=2293572 RepID=A0A372JK25_9ACTN|nr:ATP-binding protein [Actinomadura logoneensis]RFU40166.1 HAMP domain-containing protein [Actinomadura logoneensis]
MPWRFRTRVFVVVALVAAAAVGATTWLTVRATRAEYAESAAVEQRVVDDIYETLSGYGLKHGTWEGVVRPVVRLGRSTGQRIRLTTLTGEVVVDTDTEQARTARPATRRPTDVLDPRQNIVREEGDPGSEPPLGDPSVTPTGAIAERITFYRRAMRLRACLTRRGVDLDPVAAARWPTDPLLTGNPDTLVPKSIVNVREALRICVPPAMADKSVVKADLRAAADCLLPLQDGAPEASARPPERAALTVRTCTEQLLQQRLDGITPQPLLLWLGYGQGVTGPPRVQPLRAIIAAVVVAVPVIACTLLLSRRVLAPIGALAMAARRLGAGDLSERVAVRGRDEIAELARSFNRMADSLQRSEEAQHRMVSDIAHELRTPLANIRGYLEALHDGVLAPDPDLISSLLEEAVLQQRLIDDLQDLALAESGALRMVRTPLDVRELLETCRVAHRAVAESHRVELAVEADAVPLVEADPDRLRQVIGNLVTNALAATPPGGTITLRAASRDDTVRIQVADTGRGLAPGELLHVFDRFWRADSARGRATGGRGLGLSIAQGIVQAHGGTLDAESDPGRGSTFTITLPRADRPAQA